MKDQQDEVSRIVDEHLWIKWQNIKKQGLDAALDFIQNHWAREKGFKEYYICQETLDSLFKGNFKSIEELRDFNDLQQSENKYVIISYRIDKEELGTFADIVDCIYIKD